MRKVKTNRRNRIFGLFAMFAMAIGVGVSLSSNKGVTPVKADDPVTITIDRNSFVDDGQTGYQVWNWAKGGITGKGRIYTDTKAYMQVQATGGTYNEEGTPGPITNISVTMPGSGSLRSLAPRMSATAAVTSSSSGTGLTSKTFASNSETLSWDLNAGDDYRYFFLSPSGNTNWASISFTYQIVEEKEFDTLTSLELDTSNVKKDFYTTEEFNIDNLVVIAKDQHGTPKIIDLEVDREKVETNFDGVTFNSGHIGKHDVVVTYKEGSIEVEAEPYEIVVTEMPSYAMFTKITSSEQLVLGGRYVLAGTDSNGTRVMSTTQNNNNRSAINAEMSSGKIVETEDTQMFILEEGTVDDSFAFKTENGTAGNYIYSASSSSNHLRSQGTNDANGSWKVEFASGEVTKIQSQGINTRNIMQLNGNLFAAYNNSGYTNVDIYLDLTSVSSDPTVKITTSTTSIIEGRELQMTAITQNASGATVSWSINSEATSFASINASSGLLTTTGAGSVTVTASISVSGTTYTDSLEITVNVNPYEHAGTEADPFSVADALLMATETGTTTTSEAYYVKGIISEVTDINNQFGNATFQVKDKLDDAVSFGMYRAFWGASGAQFTVENYADIKVGYEVTLLGNIVNYMNNTPQITQNGKVLEVNKAPAIAEALAFADEVVNGIGKGAEGQCEAALDLLLDEFDSLSEGGKIEYEASTNETVIAAKNRIAFMEAWVASQSSGGSGKVSTPISENNSVTATIIIGVIGLTTLAGYYFLQKKKEA